MEALVVKRRPSPCLVLTERIATCNTPIYIPAGPDENIMELVAASEEAKTLAIDVTYHSYQNT